MGKSNLLNDIKHQPNSIISKVLAKNNSGNVTFFAIDKGEKISEHTSSFLASIYCVEGNLKVMIGSEENILTNEDFINLPENIPHSVEAIEKSKFILFMLK